MHKKQATLSHWYVLYGARGTGSLVLLITWWRRHVNHARYDSKNEINWSSVCPRCLQTGIESLHHYTYALTVSHHQSVTPPPPLKVTPRGSTGEKKISSHACSLKTLSRSLLCNILFMVSQEKSVNSVFTSTSIMHAYKDKNR